MEKVALVTGGLGFIGSHFIGLFLKKNSDFTILNVDSVSYAADFNNVKLTAEEQQRYLFLKGDISSNSFVQAVFEKYRPVSVFNFAAETHVDNSILHASPFIQSNIIGTFNLLEATRNLWVSDGEPGGVLSDSFHDARFIQISTDEVYGSCECDLVFNERSPLIPRSPYSASKASADLLCGSYFSTYGLPVIVTRSSNNFGPRQHHEKFLPVIINQLFSGQKIPVYGDGQAVRNWLFVGAHCEALDIVHEHGVPGETYNICAEPCCELSNIQLIEKVFALMMNDYPVLSGRSVDDFIDYVADRPGHDLLYRMSPSSIFSASNWSSGGNAKFEDELIATIKWYQRFREPNPKL